MREAKKQKTNKAEQKLQKLASALKKNIQRRKKAGTAKGNKV